MRCFVNTAAGSWQIADPEGPGFVDFAAAKIEGIESAPVSAQSPRLFQKFPRGV